MRHYGDVDQNTVVYAEFTTVANGNSVASTLANGNVVVFKDASSANSVAGLTLSTDVGITGRHVVTVNTQANNTYYSTGSFFHIALMNGNVAGSSVAGYGVASFTIRASSSLKPTTVGRTIGVDAGGNAQANVQAWLGVAPQQLGAANGVVINGINSGNITANITGNLSGSVNAVNTTVQANVTVWTVGAITTNITGNLTGSVNSVNQNVTTGTIADNAITSTVIATGAITATKFAADAIDAAALATSAVTEIANGVLFSTTMTELTADPGASPSLGNAVLLNYMAVRNKRVVDATNSNETIANNAGTAIVTACVSDTGTVFTKQKFA